MSHRAPSTDVTADAEGIKKCDDHPREGSRAGLVAVVDRARCRRRSRRRRLHPYAAGTPRWTGADPYTYRDAEPVSKVSQQRVWLVCLVVLVGGLVTLGIFSLKAN